MEERGRGRRGRMRGEGRRGRIEERKEGEVG